MQVERITTVVHGLVGRVRVTGVNLVVGHGHVASGTVVAVPLADDVAAGASAGDIDVLAARATQIIGRVDRIVSSLAAIACPTAIDRIGARRATLRIAIPLASSGTISALPLTTLALPLSLALTLPLTLALALTLSLTLALSLALTLALALTLSPALTLALTLTLTLGLVRVASLSDGLLGTADRLGRLARGAGAGCSLTGLGQRLGGSIERRLGRGCITGPQGISGGLEILSQAGIAIGQLLRRLVEGVC